jgi:hypothetical protein
MRISFDLDDMLICRQELAKQERNRIPYLLRIWLNEPLRLGAVYLMKTLIKNKHEVWIYTTSYRHPFSVRLWLWFYGIRVSDIINQAIHTQYSRSRHNSSQPSKNPKMFGIDLHIDDSIGVEMEGQKYGFNVLVIDPGDDEWVDKVFLSVDRLRSNQ